VFVVAFQKILQLSYIDKFLSDVHLEFRDKYKNELTDSNSRNNHQFDFKKQFMRVLEESEKWGKLQAKLPKAMRTFEDSHKSKKTVASMIERRGDEPNEKKSKKSVKIAENKNEVNEIYSVPSSPETVDPNNDIMLANRRKLADKLSGNKKKLEKPKSPKMEKTPDKGKKEKMNRVWDLGGNVKDLPNLDRSKDKPEDMASNFTVDNVMVGTMGGVIRDIEVESSEEEYSSEEEEEDEDDDEDNRPRIKTSGNTKNTGIFSLFKGLVGSKNLSRDDMQNVLEKMRDHLIMKNVASDIAYKLCDSVASKLEGKVLGTFDTVANIVKTTLTEALVQILSPKRRVDILRDCLEAKKNRRPYVMSFCGVNGVGKSTNLAKICFWLIENNLNVLIAACDTFRAGAVEQLRTHTKHLNALHPPERHGGRNMVQLYEKGYGELNIYLHYRLILDKKLHGRLDC
jgi:signal recognition particle receptor subunit alpha